MAAPLATGAGGDEGLDTFLNRLLVQQEVDERGRHNLATEDLQNRQLAQQDEVKNSLAELRRIQAQGLTDASNERAREQSIAADMMGDPTVPDNIKNFIRLRASMPKGETIPPNLVAPTEKTPKSLQTHFADVDMNENGVTKHLKNVPVQVDPTQPGVMTVAGVTVDPRNVHGIQSTQGNVQFLQGPDGWYLGNKGSATAQPVTTAGGQQLGGALPANMRASEMNTQRAGSTLDRMESLLDEADSRGLIGPAAGRVYGDFLAGRVGTTGNPDNDKILGALKYDINTIAPQIALALGEGARGASSVQMLSRWEPLFNEHGKMTVKGAIGEARRMLADNDKIMKRTTKTGGQGQAQTQPPDYVWDPATGSFIPARQ